MAIHNLYIYLWHSFSPYVTFWARCVSQRLAYRGHGHDWQSICVHYICYDLDVHTGTFPHQYQVKNSVLKYWNYDANSFWVKWRDVFKRDEPVNLALGSTPDFEPLGISNIYNVKTATLSNGNINCTSLVKDYRQQRLPSIAYHLLVNLWD